MCSRGSLATTSPRKRALKEIQVCFRIMELCVIWKCLLAPLSTPSYFLSCIKPMDVCLLGGENYPCSAPVILVHIPMILDKGVSKIEI